MLKVGDKLPAGSLSEFVEVEGNGCSLGPNTFDLDEFLQVARGQLVTDFDHGSPRLLPPRRSADQTVMPFCTRRVTTHDLVFEIGRLSAISTTSPILYSSFSSCA